MRLIRRFRVARVGADHPLQPVRGTVVDQCQLGCRVLGTDRYRGQCAAANHHSANDQGSHMLSQIHVMLPPLQSAFHIPRGSPI